MKNEVAWLLIGTGDIVRKRVASALVSAPGSRLLGVCGGKGRAESVAASFGADEVFHDVAEALANTRADAVYVATAVDRHVPEALASLQAGKHVLIEKPLSFDAESAKQVVDAATIAKLKAGCAYYRRTYPRYRHVRKILESGSLGRLVAVRMCYWTWFNPEPDDPKIWRIRKSASGGGPLADVGCHMFDQLIGLFNLPVSVFAYCDTLVHDYDVEDSSAIVMTLKNGAHVSAQFGWNSKTWRHEFEFVGSEGKIHWEPSDNGPVTMTIGSESEELEFPNAENLHLPLVEDFVNAITNDGDPEIPVADALKTNQLLDGIFESAKSGRAVALG
jgi:predicted dehydrogenase